MKNLVRRKLKDSKTSKLNSLIKKKRCAKSSNDLRLRPSRSKRNFLRTARLVRVSPCSAN